MNFLIEFMKRVRFKLIVIVYIMCMSLWGISQYKGTMDLSAFRLFTVRDVQDIVGTHFEERGETRPKVKQRLEKNEPTLELQRSVSLNNAAVFRGIASVTSGVTFKLFTPVAQSWRTHSTRNIHLYGVDTCAPRQKAKLNGQEWPCGAVTTAWLVTKTLGQHLSCKHALIQNGIFYAQCFVNGVDLAEVGLAEGMLVLSKESKQPIPTQYRRAEEVARNNKVGLWSSQFTEPLQWRRDNGSYNPFAGF
ncbi:thermonuclease family protein [Bartonella phoceensis]|uniref:thermonuclease family protein n=1 Tax=Bartonella phoceensis TaxID=270249 RepID=UPI001ABA51CD|nr:thermonuclease family protein [Bartonella phoceensis]